MKDDRGQSPSFESALYLFCLARPHVAPCAQGMGLDEQSPLCSQTFQDVTAAISNVLLDDFCGPAADAHMQDLGWLGPRAHRHEAVVERAMQCSPVLPARFGTLFSSPESLEKFLRRHHAAISDFLDRVTDMEEWSVKVLLDPAISKRELLSQTHDEAGQGLPSSPGIRYLQQKRIRADLEKQLNHWVTEVTDRIANDLNAQAEGCCRRRVLRYGDGSEGRDTILNWAFLVPRAGVRRFHSRIARANLEYASRGIVLAATGPWPPHSFCPSLENESENESGPPGAQHG